MNWLTESRLRGVSASELPLRLALFIGLCDSIVAFSTAVVARPSASGLIFGAVWIAIWGTALTRAVDPAEIVKARPWLLPAFVALAMMPAILDGGYPGNLATQPIWIVLVAAALLDWRWTLATGVAAFGAKCLVFGLTATGPEPFAHGSPAEANTALLLPLALVPLSLAMIYALKPLTGMAAPVPSAAAGSGPEDGGALSAAQIEIVDLLASGLSPKQISFSRGTSLATVRTQIKQAKRKTGARTLEDLVARSWRPQ